MENMNTRDLRPLTGKEALWKQQQAAKAVPAVDPKKPKPPPAGITRTRP